MNERTLHTWNNSVSISQVWRLVRYGSEFITSYERKDRFRNN